MAFDLADCPPIWGRVAGGESLDEGVSAMRQAYRWPVRYGPKKPPLSVGDRGGFPGGTRLNGIRWVVGRWGFGAPA